MIKVIGNRYPRLFFSDDGDEPFYFKEDITIPEEIPERPRIPDGEPMSYEEHRDIFLSCASRSVRVPAGERILDRSVATWQLAELLGIGDIIVPAYRSTFYYEGRELSGIKMPPASGVSYSDLIKLSSLAGYRFSYSVCAVRQLTILVMFDFLCGQIDRHSKNIRLILPAEPSDMPPAAEGADELLIKGICAIDHDMSFGLNGYEDIRKRISAGRCICPEMLGQMQYTAIDEPFYERVAAVSDDEYRRVLSPLITEAEIEAFFDRLGGLKAAVDRCRAEEKKASDEAGFFPRFISSDDMYSDYQSRMEDFAFHGGRDNWDLRFSYRPSYLKKYILTHEMIQGSDSTQNQGAIDLGRDGS